MTSLTKMKFGLVVNTPSFTRRFEEVDADLMVIRKGLAASI